MNPCFGQVGPIPVNALVAFGVDAEWQPAGYTATTRSVRDAAGRGATGCESPAGGGRRIVPERLSGAARAFGQPDSSEDASGPDTQTFRRSVV